MPKLFDTAFAANGDKNFVPNDTQTDGSVSYAEGFGADYEKDPLDASSKPVPRQGTNQILFDISGAVGDIQRTGFPTWSPDAAALLGGYPRHAIVWFAGDSWQSQINGNTSRPDPDALNWFASSKYQGGGGGGGTFSLVGPTTVAVGGAFTYTISPYSSFMTYSATATHGTVAINGQTLTLTIAAGEASNVTDLTVLRSDGASNAFRIAIGAQSVAQPSILSPIQGAVDVPLGPTLVGSAFATYPVGADTHLNTDWRIRNGGGTVVWQSLADAINRTTIKVPENALPLNTLLTVDVRYRGATLPVSAYSAAVTFTTTNQSITTPTITDPLNGTIGIGAEPKFTSSAFSTNPLGADTHASSDWRLKDSGGVIIWSSTADAVNKTTIAIPRGILAISSQYTMEVRYNGAILQPSQWSPVVSFTTAVAFDYGKYMAVAHATTPFVTAYGQDIDTFTKLTNPATLPTGDGQGVAFSADGVYMAVACATTPYITIYKRSGDTFTKLANPATLPASVAYGVAFSADGVYMAVAHATSPYITVYKRSGDTFTKLTNPVTLPASVAYGVAFSADGVYMAVAHSTTPCVTIYKRSGDTFTKLTNPVTLPTIAGRDVAFSADGVYMAVTNTALPYLTVYKRSGDTFAKLTDPAALPTGTAYGVAFYPPVMGA